LNYLRAIVSDARGISMRCGWWIMLRWLWNVAMTLPICVKNRNLQAADRRMGNGPFLVSRRGARARLSGQQVFSGIREIWVRDVYLKDNYLVIPGGALVVDFGANLGNFTNLALAQHDDVRVIAVEPSLKLSKSLQTSIAENGWANRAAVKRAFVGLTTKVQLSIAGDPDYRDAPFITEDAFLDEFKIRQIDFLKCDIEGSEFFMLEPESKLLSLTRNLAIEIHAWGGSIALFLDKLRILGFEIGSIAQDASGTCIALCKRPMASSPRIELQEAISGWGEATVR
jgi:FkbM family methyltransferase